jgi:tRNA threonylcarbamoyladenosine biosynthesis protein TsaE
MDRSGAASPVGELRSRSPADTRELGRRLGGEAARATVLALIGPLGAGKTLLAKGVAEGLGVTGVVNSPTFVLMNEHLGRLTLYHIDAYRLDDPEEAVTAGLLDDRQAGGVTVVEWADCLSGWLPADRLEIEMEALPGEPMSRTLRWRALGAAHASLADRTLAGAARADGVAAAT